MTVKINLLKNGPGTLFPEGIAQYTEREKGGEGSHPSTQKAVPWPSHVFMHLLSELGSVHSCNFITQETGAMPLLQVQGQPEIHKDY